MALLCPRIWAWDRADALLEVLAHGFPVHRVLGGKGAVRDKPYSRGGGGGKGLKACNNCGVVGHLAGQCPEPAQCHACGSTAHAVADCPHKDKTCSICGKVGHLKVSGVLSCMYRNVHSAHSSAF